MKTNKLTNFLMLFAIVGLIFTGCKKDNSSSSSSSSGVTSAQASQAQNSDEQDAVSDRAEQDADNNVDQLQANNYTIPATKGDGSITITLTKGVSDSSTFPKTFSIVYSNYADSSALEKFVFNGEIDVTISLAPNAKNALYTVREYTFKSFSVETDSLSSTSTSNATTITVSGTRTVTRTSVQYYIIPPLKGIRLVAVDSIDANTTWAITNTGSTDTLHFTRIVRRQRTSDINFININTTATKWKQIVLVSYPHLDTIFWTGTVKGVNEAGDNYSKYITTELQGTWYSGTPVLIAGAITDTIKTTTPSIFGITFKRDLPDHPFRTLVTITNEANGKTHSFDRRFWGFFNKWW